MDPFQIPPQSHYLYQDGWNKTLDSFLIKTLVYHKKSMKWVGSTIPTEALTVTHRAVNFLHKVEVSMEELITRIELLKQRHRCFAYVSNLNVTHWHREENVVLPADRIWAEIFQTDPFAKAYYHEAEPEFLKLCVLFGPLDHEIKVESERSQVCVKKANSVINISDSTQSPAHIGHNVIQKCESDEITSPSPISARRRLFQANTSGDHNLPHSEGGPSDLASCNHWDPRFPPPNYFPRRPFISSSKGEKPGSSSCASSSPPPSAKKKWFK